MYMFMKRLSIVWFQPEPLKDLNELAKAQLEYHAAAAEALANMQGELEELALAADNDYK